MMNSYGTAGRNAREMAQQRYKKVVIYAAFLFLIAIVIFPNLNNIARLGLPASIILAVVIKLVTDGIEKKGLYKRREPRMLIVVPMLKKWLLKSSGIYRMAIMHSMTLLLMALT